MTESCRRAAVLSDVHGNAVALASVLRELDALAADLVVFGGDLTWGPLPHETLALVDGLRTRTVFIRGNADRALIELGQTGKRRGESETTPRERWMLEVHTDEQRTFVERFVEDASVTIDGLGPVRFCHGSPRSDEEVITYATPEARIRALMSGVDERVLVSAHTHIQFDREIAGVRSINPGSVGMPYGGRAGSAYWALLGPDIELRRTDYDLDEAIRLYRASSDPLAEDMVEMLLTPPSSEEVVEHAEAVEFSG